MSLSARWPAPLNRDGGTIRALRTILFCTACWSGVAAVIARRMGASGVILMFHEVRPRDKRMLSGAASVRLLEFALRWLRRDGWVVVNLDEALQRLEDTNPSARFAVLTFDDGYRDLVSCALPVLADHGAPFTVYIPTGALTKELYSWWLGLREVFRRAESVTIDAMGTRFECPTITEKRKAMAEIEAWVSADYRRAALLSSTFRSERVSLEQLNREYFLDEIEVQRLARHPLASIGAHTTSHVALATLDRETARREMADNRAYLENLIQQPVLHFANPHGGPGACGPREAVLAEELGFSSAVTTRHGHLFRGHRSNRFMLSRIGFNGTDTPTTLVAQLRGVKSAMQRLIERGNR
jgi:peptidoglycan/xylan/chitin deacetylase (PgdA/CDA1 family)